MRKQHAFEDETSAHGMENSLEEPLHFLSRVGIYTWVKNKGGEGSKHMRVQAGAVGTSSYGLDSREMKGEMIYQIFG